jgi:hypothetical protein
MKHLAIRQAVRACHARSKKICTLRSGWDRRGGRERVSRPDPIHRPRRKRRHPAKAWVRIRGARAPPRATASRITEHGFSRPSTPCHEAGRIQLLKSSWTIDFNDFWTKPNPCPNHPVST